MRDTDIQDHLTLVELLPDFVLGKLDETSLHRVTRHLEDCQICRNESVTAMEALGTLADVPPPPAFLRGAVLRRAAAFPPALGQSGLVRHVLPPQQVGAEHAIRLLESGVRASASWGLQPPIGGTSTPKVTSMWPAPSPPTVAGAT